jgi:peptide/nickel transport system substrate-binding protein
MSTYSSPWSRIAASRLTRRRLLRGAAAGAGAAALIACGSEGGGNGALKLDDAGTARQPGTVWSATNDWKLADETKEAVRGGIYRSVMPADQAGHFDAIQLADSQKPFAVHVYEMLMSQTRGPGIQPGTTAYNNPSGALAESWEVAPDGASVTFKLRQGVKFHPVPPVNGRVMDIDDWKTSLDRFLAVGFYRSDIGGILDKAEYPDATTMVWKLKFPYAPIVTRIPSSFFAYYILPKELNADVPLAERQSAGTGFKILDKHQPSITMEYRKHKDYWGGDPFIERWHAPIIPEYANQYAQFVRGNIMDFQPTAKDVLLLHKDAANAVIVAGAIAEDNASRYLFGRFVPATSPLNDPRVRVAIRRSIDFKSIGEFLSNKTEFEQNGIPVQLKTMTHLPPDPGYWLDPEKDELGKVSANYLYDPAEAKKLTAAAGNSGPVPLFYPVRLAQGQFEVPDQLVIDSLKKTGTFDLDILQVPTAPEYRKYNVDREMEGLAGTQIGSSNDADYFVTRDYSRFGPFGEQQAFPHAKIDEFQKAQRKEVDPERRNAVLKEFQIFMAEWMPSIPGRHAFTTFSFRWPWLHNVNYGPPISASVGPPAGRPVQGGHLHWLDKAMPNRESGAL